MFLIPNLDQYMNQLINEYYEYKLRINNLRFPIKIVIINTEFIKKRYIDAYDIIGQYNSIDELYDKFLSKDDEFSTYSLYVGKEDMEDVHSYLRKLSHLEALDKIDEIKFKDGRFKIFFGLTREQIGEDIFGKTVYQRIIKGLPW